MRSVEYSGERLRAVIEAQGRRVDWLADTAGVHRTLIWKVVTGKVTFTPRLAEKLAAALSVELAEFEPVGEATVAIAG